MMKSFFNKFALCLAGVLIVLCYSCSPTEQAATDTVVKPTATETKQPETKPVNVRPTETKPVAVEQKPKEQPVGKETDEQSNIAAEIGNYVITREQLEQRLSRQLRRERDDYIMEETPIDAKTVLLKMIAEKAMIMEGRKQDYLKDESFIKRFREEKLVGLLLATELQGKISVTDSEIDEKIKADPKLERARAKAVLEREKQTKAVNQFYNELYEKRNVRKVRHNFPKASQIHRRLLMQPQKERKGYWIKGWQIKEELTPGEKSIALATFDGGKVTLKGWFDTLHLIPPRARWKDWKDLNTIQGVERLLDRAIRMPIFVAEAESRGLDRDERFLQQVRTREERALLSKVSRKVSEDIKRLTEEEASDYFNKHREEFRTSDKLKIDQIWCEDLKTAQKVKDELSRDMDFESVKQQYSLKKKSQPLDISAKTEKMFFQALWNGEPNDITGPVRGFYDDGIKWRIVKILEKKPGRMKKYSNSVERDVKRRVRDKRRKAAMDKYRKELLGKYSYKIYPERIKDIDPLNIP